jgi:hypothetical protein
MAEAPIQTKWRMTGRYIKNCNCDSGCPCDFNSDPTHHHCTGMAGMEITDGAFGDTSISGLKWAATYYWPGPLHEGNGNMQPFIDANASAEQRDALLQIMSGQNGGKFTNRSDGAIEYDAAGGHRSLAETTFTNQ